MCLVFSCVMTVFASNDATLNVSFSTVKTNTIKGDSKVKISVDGAKGKVKIAQIALKLDGNMTYKGYQILKGKNDPDNGEFFAVIGTEDGITLSIISKNGLDFFENQDLAILTFTGEENASLKLDLDLEHTYCIKSDGSEIIGKDDVTETLTPSKSDIIGKNATVRLVMNKVTDFASTPNAQLTLKITDEKEDGDSIETTINATHTSKGGHRDGSETPTFVVKSTVISSNTYTVEVSGIGYITYKKTGVTFDETLEIKNDSFIPGDVNNDGKVDVEDKKMVKEVIEKSEYSIGCDFNRDGSVDEYDLKLFSEIKDDEEDNKDNNQGNDNNNNGNNGESSNGSSSGGGNSGGSAGGTTTTPTPTPLPSPSVGGGGSSGGGGGGGYSGGGSSSGGSYTGGTTSTETFVDLGNYAWAKDSIYTLKNKGIISGVSANEFAPANNIKRGDFILILTRMLGISHEFSENFVDVPAGSYYYNAIGSAKAGGIANGNNGYFMPEDSITRQDLIVLAYRAFCAMGYISETNDLTVLDTFADKDQISDYAKTAMASMVNSGIIKGSDGNVNPLGYATRAEVAVMCARMLNLMQ